MDLRAEGSADNRSRSQSTSSRRGIDEEEGVVDNDLSEEDMEKLRKALRIITERMDDSSA